MTVDPDTIARMVAWRHDLHARRELAARGRSVRPGASGRIGADGPAPSRRLRHPGPEFKYAALPIGAACRVAPVRRIPGDGPNPNEALRRALP